MIHVEGFTPYRGRGLGGVLYVAVYRNLNDPRGCPKMRWSIRDRLTQHVVGRADRLAVTGACTHVGEGAQRRIAEGGKKTPHAWVWGALTTLPDDGWFADALAVTYQPRENPWFRYVEQPDRLFHHAPLVVFDQSGMWVAP
jgi:hypothetical protein